jgi:hypothetical protein
LFHLRISQDNGVRLSSSIPNSEFGILMMIIINTGYPAAYKYGTLNCKIAMLMFEAQGTAG